MANELSNVTNGFMSTLSANSGNDAAIKARIANAIISPDSLAESESDIFYVTDIIKTPSMRKSRNGGEDTPCFATILALQDGTAVMSQSDGISRSVEIIMTLYPDCGRSDGYKYLPIKCVEKKLRNGNTLKSLVVALDELERAKA